MRKLTYYAVFELSAGSSYCVYWPDLPGCTSWGKTLQQTQVMAAEALGLHIYRMEQDGDLLPEPTTPPFAEMPQGGIVMPIVIFPDIVKNELDNRAVKTTKEADLKLDALTKQTGRTKTFYATQAIIQHIEVYKNKEKLAKQAR
jgi:predicted RNase H-like HicB family nuclease